LRPLSWSNFCPSADSMKSMNNLAALGRGAFFRRENFIRVDADEWVWRDPLKRRAFLGVFVDPMLIKRYRHGKFSRGDQFAYQRVTFAEIDLLRGETTPVIQPSFLAVRLQQSTK